ncbi:inorganic diphosphatase [Nocardioides donggukensis]|uniref:inorganic diphosphatase n=1 Tax=Nocardioides donggukensis TaxID=2774019 RepID=A0A927Q1M2_9ACTN|nr:inorganic diphosphatase [Nocardioides donggukensis]MBD8868876.1 inorganic diphosphatase [Nocardioides donggukensis]
MTDSNDLDRSELHADGRCDVVVEIPRGSRNKYEASDDGEIWFDRRLGGPAGFPGDYGYVIGADGEDGDALDALVLIDEATFPGVHVRCRVIGSYLLRVGDVDETKLIAVPEADHHADHITDLLEMPEAFLEELGAFFHAYRMLESKSVEVLERHGRDAAVRTLVDA